MKITKQQVIDNLAQVKEYLAQIDNPEVTEWVEINNENCPTLEKYGAKPFRIMKQKMRNAEGEVWNNINFFEAKKEAESRGYRLPDIREMLALLEWYKTVNQDTVSHKDKEFLGIEELSYDEDVCYEWVGGAGLGFIRGANWGDASYAGTFTLYLSNTPTVRSNSIGFRMCRDMVVISQSKESKKEV